MKKFLAGIASLVMCASALTAPMQTAITNISASAASDYNYAEALQKSMFFYEVQQAGELPDWNEVSWRADSMLTDEVPGGWFDAGDHFKFALTNAYTAAIMAWGVIEYKDALKKAGLYETYMNNLQWGLDYVAGCDRGDAVVGTIGDGFDHQWWGSAEVYMRKYKLTSESDTRPFDLITSTSTTSQMAAAMAAGYIAFKDENPTLAESYLKHAESLFELSDTTRSNEDQGVQKSYYPATDYFDDLFYAANWLYRATGEQKYLDKCDEYIPNLATESQSTERKFTWGFCWDDALQGASLLYYENTGKEEWKTQIDHHLQYWIDGYGGKQVAYTPDGLAWLMEWGALRHVTTTAWLAKLASDVAFKDDAAKAEKYNNWAKQQLDYCFGDNDLKLCYVQGMGENNPKTFHHRTASGIHDDHWQSLGLSEEDAEGWQTEYAHTLYGALEGGPSKDGTFTDEVGQYQYTEVAIDYNAGYTALLCAMVDDYDCKPLADFPPTETPKWNEFEVAAVIQQNQASYTQLQVWAMNHSAWPARVVKDLSYRYYFDISEVLDAGLSVNDIKVSIGYDQHAGDEGALSVSEPIQYKDNVYYIEMKFNDGSVVMPTGQSEHRAEAQIRIAVADTAPAGAWDPTNDYSFQGLQEGGQDLLKSPEAITPYITMYDGGTLIYGTEPDGTTPSETSVVKPTEKTTENENSEPTKTTDPSNTEDILYGDVDMNGEVDILDIITLNKNLLGKEIIDADQQKRADVDVDTKITSSDAMLILKKIVGMVETLPINS